MEDFIPRVQRVDVEEAVGLRDRRLVHRLKLGLWCQCRQLLQQAVLFQLVPQPPHAEELVVDAHGVAHEAQLLGAHKSADLEVPAAHKQRVQRAVARSPVQVRIVGEIVYNDQNLEEGSQPSAASSDLSLLANNLAQCRLVPLLLPVHRHRHSLPDVLPDGAPAVVYVYTRAENHDTLQAALACSKIMLTRVVLLPDFDGPTSTPVMSLRASSPFLWRPATDGATAGQLWVSPLLSTCHAFRIFSSCGCPDQRRTQHPFLRQCSPTTPLQRNAPAHMMSPCIAPLHRPA